MDGCASNLEQASRPATDASSFAPELPLGATAGCCFVQSAIVAPGAAVLLALGGSAVGLWVTFVVVAASLVVTIRLWRLMPATVHRRWLPVGASAGLLGTIGTIWLGTVIRSSLQFEPPESNGYGDYKFIYDVAPWVGGLVGLLLGVAVSLIVLRLRSDQSPT